MTTAVPGPVAEKKDDSNDEVEVEEGGGKRKLKRSQETDTPATTAQLTISTKVDVGVSMMSAIQPREI
ncbi:uncharacterized protein SPSK_11018 [Sporothrix schenckii 1099-18]|uniref:Uncharacterized protein n=1 Tax=Sporothrix schenckii 1099-18 TaxID=1397361 RepID=A0A0F2M9C7_SPOSC|nr:uncharacterized protein SPSK_11018 [Sporothrix schenckii 1099-18]KJR84761.1 hypothetical protein SPSK_11018 [Sporothrix schenckii 1099-18]